MVLTPKESGKFITKNAEHVKIIDLPITVLGDMLLEEFVSGRLSATNFSQNVHHPKPEDPWAIDWIFLVDTLNFSFWHFDNEKGWVVDGQSGYFALCAAVNRAMKEKIDILNPNYYTKLTENELKHIARSDNEVPIPLFPERIRCLHEVGTILLQKFNGSFATCVKQANHSAVKLLQIVTENFPCFCDEATYRNQQVALYKRAQILIGDLWACFEGKGPGYFHDLDEITMFPDYRIPQSLLYFGAFEYGSELIERLKKDEFLENGSEMEVEIRGCSIEAVERLKEYVNQKAAGKVVSNSILIDHFLWDFRRKNAKKICEMGLPYHKTRCIYY